VVDVIVPARNAAATIGEVLARLPHRQIRSVVVVDNGSTDATSQIARDAGVVVLREPRGGHGNACLAAMSHLALLPQPPDIVVFVPGDAAVDASAVPAVLAPFSDEATELVIGVGAKAGAADRAVYKLIGAVYRHRVHGVGGLRAIRYPALVALGMSDRRGGWDVEMLVRALKLGLSIVEVQLPNVAGAGGGSSSGLASKGRSLFHILRHATMR
jgi:glycosyltransferase involved in cell wall biosynthesis